MLDTNLNRWHNALLLDITIKEPISCHEGQQPILHDGGENLPMQEVSAIGRKLAGLEGSPFAVFFGIRITEVFSHRDGMVDVCQQWS